MYKCPPLPLLAIYSPIFTMLITVPVSLLSLLSLPLISPTPLESLLHRHISSAQCMARCQGIEESQIEASVARSASSYSPPTLILQASAASLTCVWEDAGLPAPRNGRMSLLSPPISPPS